MLLTIFVVLLLLWLVGVVSSYTLGGFIHSPGAGAVVMLIRLSAGEARSPDGSGD